DTLRVDVLSPKTAILNELCFARVSAEDQEAHSKLLDEVRPYSPHIVRVDANSVVLTLTATPTTIDRFLLTLAPFRLIDVSSTDATCAQLRDDTFKAQDLQINESNSDDLLKKNEHRHY